MKGDLQDVMGWDGAHVVDPDGVIVGLNRKLKAPDCDYVLSGGFGTKHNSGLAFASSYPAVVIVRSDSQEKGVTILSHAALQGGGPVAYKLSFAAANVENPRDEEAARFIQAGIMQLKTPGDCAHYSQNEQECGQYIPGMKVVNTKALSHPSVSEKVPPGVIWTVEKISTKKRSDGTYRWLLRIFEEDEDKAPGWTFKKTVWVDSWNLDWVKS
eukprot:FR735921.1.p1 GENE.FR735921.1~~FR735921.1.p1  ORF type:complete len:213 (+),score=11.95 FR735921.1:117-755(+)